MFFALNPNCFHSSTIFLFSEKFLSNVIPNSQDLSLNKHSMMTDYRFKDEEIT